jgi:hypothetical protein
MTNNFEISGSATSGPEKLFIATPFYGGMLTDAYFHSMLRLTQVLSKKNIGYMVSTMRNESLLPRSRNTHVALFLESGCSHMIFIDADIEFDPASILRMMATGKDVIAGPCPHKTIPPKFALNFLFDGDPRGRKLITDNGAIEVKDAGTGLLMVRREAFTKMMEAYPDLKYVNNLSGLSPNLSPYFYSFFDTMHDPDSHVFLSEDFTFCYRWRKIGGRVWIDPQAVQNHVGTHTFTGNLDHMIAWEDDGTCRLRGPVVFEKPGD